MKYLPCIPDEVLSPEIRKFLCEIDSALPDHCIDRYIRTPANRVVGDLRRLFWIIDDLAAAYLDVARERDKWKGVCDLAGDEKFWKALEVIKMGGEDG